MKKVIKNNLIMLQYIRKYCPSQIPIAIYLAIIQNIIGLFDLLYTRFVIESLTNDVDLINIAIPLLALIILNITIYTFNQYLSAKIVVINSLKLTKGLQNEIYLKSIYVPYEYFHQSDYYDKYSIAIQQAGSRAESVLTTISTFTSSLFGVLIFGGFIMIYDSILVYIVIFEVLISLGFTFLSSKIQHESYEAKVFDTRRSSYSQRVFYLEDYAKEIRINHGIFDILIKQFNSSMSNLIRITKKYSIKLFKMDFINQLLSSTLYFWSSIYIIYRTLKKYYKVSDFVVLFSGISQLSGQLKTLFLVIPELYGHSMYINDFKEFMNIKTEENKNNQLCSLNSIESIVMKNLFFSYPGSEDKILSNINLNFQKGSVTAIIGENGSGKSTILKILAGLYKTSIGEIYINDINLNRYDINDYRESINYIFQDYHIYAVSIAENILLRPITNREYDEEIVKKALKKVGLYDKIMNLSKNIYTNITYEYDSKGVLFSGGEIQKIVLARIFARPTSIIILDEPTSSIDTIYEKDIIKKIMELKNDRIIIFISHNLKNIVNCDSIYLLREGKVVASGKHDNLIKDDVYYQDYWYQNTSKNQEVYNETL